VSRVPAAVPAPVPEPESGVPGVAVIMPVLDEAPALAARLPALLDYGFDEIIVVDGGSRDGGPAIVAELAGRSGGRLTLVTAPAGRALQMNAGAARARAALLLFLHTDTVLRADAAGRIRTALAAGHDWGRFDVRLDGRRWAYRVIERLMNLRSRLSGIATGDQAIFVRRVLFQELGGYAPIPLMEDIDLSRRLKRHGRPACIRSPVLTSARRWERGGVARTVLLMWRLRLLYWLGAAPERLARRYRVVR